MYEFSGFTDKRLRIILCNSRYDAVGDGNI